VASRAFKDINLSFKRHPVTNDLVTIKNEDAIKRSVKNIIFTILGEKPFSPSFGSFISESLFSLNTEYDSITLEDEIKNIPTVCGSLREAMESLDTDRSFLKEGGVFSDDQIDAYIALKFEEIYNLEHTPHPIEFDMYYSS